MDRGPVAIADRLILWPATPYPGCITLLEIQRFPPQHWVLKWERELGELLELLRDPQWIDRTLRIGPVGSKTGPADSATPTEEWRKRHVVRVSEGCLADVASVARSCLANASDAHAALAIWIDAERISSLVLRSVIELEKRIHAHHCHPAGASAAPPVMLLHGHLGRVSFGELQEFTGQANRALIPVVPGIDAHESRGEREPAALSLVGGLADAGAVVPVELAIDTACASEVAAVLRPWAEANRGAGLLLTPDTRTGDLGSATDFARWLLQAYDLDMLPSSRLFPVNLALASLCGETVPPIFAADVLGDLGGDPVFAAPEYHCKAARKDGTVSQLVQLWAHSGVPLPTPGSFRRKWLEHMAVPLYERLVCQLAERLITSGLEGASAPSRKRAELRRGHLMIEDWPAEGASASADDGTRCVTSGIGSGPQPVRPSVSLGCGWPSNGRARCSSLPRHMAINVIDLDVTKQCNLRCTYCFKSDTVHPGGEGMSLEVARAAVDWLIDAAMGADQLWVHLMGGEPLLRWDMIEQLVPYAKLRAATFGAEVQFGVTTNLTLVTPEIVDFSRQWGMGWHCSIDGIPGVQNAQRPRVGGGPSSEAAERGAKLILAYRPTACARSTVTPDYVGSVHESLLHFERLGFVNFAFASADEASWTKAHLVEWSCQWASIAEHVIRRYREGKRLMVAAFDWIIEQHISNEEKEYSCGAGRGSVMVDPNGDLWPCHRWDGADSDSGSDRQWRLGNIFAPGFNDRLHCALLDRDRSTTRNPGCARCPLERMCAGGCPAANLALTKSIYQSHAGDCRAIQAIYPHAIQLHDTLVAERNRLFMETFYDKDNAQSAA